MSIKSFYQFINEEEKMAVAPIFPTHEELSSLSWFRALERVLRTIDIEVLWNTGRLAYDRGTRKLITQYDETRENQKIDTFSFYPKNGNIYCNQFTMKSGVPFDSLDSWNAALFLVYCKAVAGQLGLSNLARLKSAILGQDRVQLVNVFKEANARRSTELPEEFLFAVLQEVSDADEIAAIQDLLDLGLI